MIYLNSMHYAGNKKGANKDKKRKVNFAQKEAVK